jgi:predicted dehydrogenase
MNSRRDFLQKLGVSTIALQLASVNVWANEKNTKHEPYDGPVLRVAIMGLGGYGTRVAGAMQSCTKAKLVGAISGTPKKLTDWQDSFSIPAKNCYNYQTYQQIKDNPDIDAVYITTPNGLHHDMALAVAKAGKHVICEKPMALNAKQGQEWLMPVKRQA